MATPRAPSQVSEVQSDSGRFFAILLLAFIIFTSLIVIIIWLSVQPKHLKYSVERSSITSYNLTNDGHLNATFNFLLRSNNLNRRISFYFDKIDVNVSYENTNLFIGNAAPFYQRRKNVTDLELNLIANDVVVRGKVAENLKLERASGDVILEVKISAKIRLKIGVFKVHRSLEAHCGPFAVPFSSSKGFNRVPCHVHISL